MNMKNMMMRMAGLVLVGLTAFHTAGCKKDDDPSAEEKFRKLIETTWTISEVFIDDVDKSSDFQGLTLQFGTQTYSSTNGEPLWPSSGTWALGNTDITQIVRDAQLVIDVEEISETKLTLSFDWDDTTYGPGRVASIAGRHKFVFVR